VLFLYLKSIAEKNFRNTEFNLKIPLQFVSKNVILILTIWHNCQTAFFAEKRKVNYYG